MNNSAHLLTTVESKPRRVIVFGDIHGCYDELVMLLERIRADGEDLVIAAGDIVRKGPAPARCLDLWRERGHLAVLGNNELKVRGRSPLSWIFHPGERDVLRRPELLRYIASWPLAIDIPALRVSIVHGGVLPGTDFTERSLASQSNSLPRLRYVRREYEGWRYVPKGKEVASDALWPTVWDGDRFVLYGHTPLRRPRFDRSALGLDTGCVYGGALTAAILENGEWRTESVPAKQAYAE